jgi:hypothetical protein
MGYLTNGVTTGGVPMELIKTITNGFHVPFFVETGTAGGASIREASIKFEFCYTIELMENVTPPKDTFPENIMFFNGTSSEKIHEVVSILKTKISKHNYALFWLDAHYSAPSDDTPSTPDNFVECPLLKEIDAIGEIENSIIIIDDARLFLGAPPYPLDPRKWPSLTEIFKRFMQYYPEHHFSVVDDYIICVPKEMKDNLNQDWRLNFRKRYPLESDKAKFYVKEAYKTFLKFIDHE